MSELKQTHPGGDVGKDEHLKLSEAETPNVETHSIPDLSAEDATRQRVHDQDENSEENNKRLKLGAKLEDSLVSTVAAHYNTIEEKGLAERNKSRIVYLRNFNNWIKSQLINEYLQRAKGDAGNTHDLRVLDMGCGKGGDLLKWKKANIKHLICVDLADVSIKQCRDRYEEMKDRDEQSRGRYRYNNFPPIFSAEFYPADCTQVRIKDKFENKSQEFDLVSCQFSFHYCFESLPQAECMLRNAAESLRPGGYFIGTIPDAQKIVYLQKKAGERAFGNDVYKIEFNCDVKELFPLFGAKYDFFLEGVVDCPEFLVHFPTLIKLAEKYGLKFVKKQSFQDYFELMKEPGRQLLGRMQAFETYPPWENEKLTGKDDEYVHAKNFLNDHTSSDRVGTLSRSEWEALTLYMVFAFVKV